jgi:hypothetical protein
VDGERLEIPRDMERKEVEERKNESEERVPKSFRIDKQDLEAHGYSAKCLGCLAVLRGTTLQRHSPGCRQRLGEAMKEEEKVKKASRKIDLFLERVVERADEQRKAKRAATDRERENSGHHCT